MAARRCNSRALRRRLVTASRSKAMWSRCCSRVQARESSWCASSRCRGPPWPEFSRSTGWRGCGRRSARHADGHMLSPSPTTDDQGQVLRGSERMSKLGDIARAAMVGAVALLVATAAAAAQDAGQPLRPLQKHRAAPHGHTAMRVAKPPATRQMRKPSAVVLAVPAPAGKAQAPAEKKQHHLVLQVNTNDPAAMNLALNNATNVAEYYGKLGEPVKIEG